MPDAPETIRAFPPSRSTRLRLDETGAVVIHVSDEGQHGYPRALALLAVERTDGGLSVLHSEPLGYDCFVGDNRRTRGSYTLAVPSVAWPQGGDAWLLVLLFNQNGDRPQDCEFAAFARQAVAEEPSVAYWRRSMLRVPAPLPAGPTPAAANAAMSRLAPPAEGASVAPGDVPSNAETQFAFVLCSCQYPHDILDRTPTAGRKVKVPVVGPADASMMAMKKLLEHDASVQLLIQAGDQVYVDATAGLFDPTTLRARFDRAYALQREVYGAVELHPVLPSRVECLIDDHEIANNWQPGDTDPAKPKDLDEPLKSGLEAWWDKQRLAGTQEGGSPLWRTLKVEGRHFFLGDTRTGRSARNAINWRAHDTQILDSEQWKALKNWLNETRDSPHPRFIATPAILLPRPSAVARDAGAALLCDSWAGYPASLHRLLELIMKEQHQNLVFLSGDEHLGAVARVDVEDQRSRKKVTLHSIHSQAMYAPYPFANARQRDFAAHETFDLHPPPSCPAAATLRCHVTTRFPPAGDGFAVVSNDANVVSVAFHGRKGRRQDGQVTLPLPPRSLTAQSLQLDEPE